MVIGRRREGDEREVDLPVGALPEVDGLGDPAVGADDGVIIVGDDGARPAEFRGLEQSILVGFGWIGPVEAVDEVAACVLAHFDRVVLRIDGAVWQDHDRVRATR